jgi:nucleoside-diphosphate-sugar epimerase
MAYCRNQPITIFGDGSQSRDFTFVSDIVEANLLAARSAAKLGGQVFNIGCGAAYSLNEMVRVLNELTGKAVTPAYGPKRPGDVQHSLADITRARATLGYQPAVRFREGLSRTLDWYRTTLGEAE